MTPGEVLEYAVLLSVKLQDQALFERQFNQLNTFYTDTRYVLRELALYSYQLQRAGGLGLRARCPQD